MLFMTDEMLLTLFSYGGGFQDGASLLYNGSAIVAQSVARVCSFLFTVGLKSSIHAPVGEYGMR